MADRAAAGLECRNLVKAFPGAQTRALDDVCLTIRAGEFFTLLGPSGCGKTTLLRAIGGFERQDSGSILLDGVAIDANPPYRRPVNTVFQSYAVFPHMSVASNIAFGLKMQRCTREEMKRRVREMVTLVRLDGLEDRRPDQLSGGQQQRVALARALAASPRVLLLDEPLSALDLKLRTEMQLELKRLQSEVGITFVFVTHDQTEALALSDRIAVMRAGKVLQVDQPQGIYDRPASRFVADFIGESNLLPAQRIAPGRYRLGCGGELSAPVDEGVPASVTLAVRPERVMLVRSEEANGLHATVEQIVYLGSDTIYHLRLADGAPVRAREQNRSGTASFAKVGANIGIRIGPEAAHVLPD